MIRAHVSLRREPVLPGDVRRSKPPRMFQVVVTDTDAPMSITVTGFAYGTTIGDACDYARGLIHARHAANIRRAILNPSEV